jgi:hypothetical protein
MTSVGKFCEDSGKEVSGKIAVPAEQRSAQAKRIRKAARITKAAKSAKSAIACLLAALLAANTAMIFFS